MGSGVLDDTTSPSEQQQLDSFAEVAASELLQFAVASAAERRKPAATVFLPSASKQLQQVRQAGVSAATCLCWSRAVRSLLRALQLACLGGLAC
jgi:hypothetical protein